MDLLILTRHWPDDAAPQARMSFAVAQTCAQLGHNVRVLTTENPRAQHLPQVEVLQPFRRWSWWEWVRLAPYWPRWRPQLVIWLAPSPSDLAKFIGVRTVWPGARLVASYFTHSELRTAPLATFATWLDEVTLSSELVKSLPRGIPGRARLGEWDCIWPEPPEVEDLPSSLQSARTSMDAWPLTVALGNVDDFSGAHAESLARAEKKRSVIIVGDWGATPRPRREQLLRIWQLRQCGQNLLLTGPLRAGQRRTLMREAYEIWLPQQPPDCAAEWARMENADLVHPHSSLAADQLARLLTRHS